MDWAKQVHISALHGSGLRELMRAVVRAHASATKELVSSDLTKTLEKAYEGYQPPLVHGHAPKLRFAHPGGQQPADHRDPRQPHQAHRTGISALPRKFLPQALSGWKARRYGSPSARARTRSPASKKVLTEEQIRKRRRMVSELKKRKR